MSPPPDQESGTRVLFSLPIAGPPTLLVVGPDPGAQTCLGRQLREHGYRVESDVRGDSTLTRVGAGHLDLVIMDLLLEDMEGLDVILTLKQSPSFRYVPIIAVTATTMDETTTEVLTRFEIPTLPKSYRPEDLIETVERVLLSKTVFQSTKQEITT
jgi:CheY-like chemotaxis protein